MPDIHYSPMPKEICCRNWVYLIDYFENTPNLPSGFHGRSATERLLEGLVDNPRFLIQDPKNSNLVYPVQESHLRDERYWHSNEFTLLLFENAAKVAAGFHNLSLRTVFLLGVLS